MATCDVRYCFFNLVDQSATDITGTNENSFFPATNIKDPRSTKVYRSTTLSDSVVFDFKTTEPVDTIIVRPDLENGFGFIGDLTVEANPTNEWTSPAYSTTLSVSQVFNLGIKFLTSAQSYRFWRVSGSGSSYFELSNIFMGSYFNAGRNVSFNWKYQNNDLSKQKLNPYGQAFIDEYSDQKTKSFEIKYLNKTEMENVRQNIDYVGKRKPFWIVVDPEESFSNDNELFAGMFYLTSIPSFSNVAYNYYNSRWSLKEAV